MEEITASIFRQEEVCLGEERERKSTLLQNVAVQ
jgi:hypothetical protein